MTADVVDHVEGPAWADHQLVVRPGRFPLSVESHLMNMTAGLVPGATTVTTSARYLALHGLVAAEAEERELPPDRALALLRRCEVLMAAASLVHHDPDAGTVHGLDVVKPHLDANGGVDIGELAAERTGYSSARAGFLGPYVGSELVLQILASTSLQPGPRLDRAALQLGFEGLFDLAHQVFVSTAELAGAAGLAIGAAKASTDGEWLARLLCSVGMAEHASDRTRRGTARLLCRALHLSQGEPVTSAFKSFVAFGPLDKDEVTASTPEAAPWRGTIFRHESVGAWRRMWAWLVEQITGLTSPDELAAALDAELGQGTLRSLVAGLPATAEADGSPATAERQVRDRRLSVPLEALSLLCLGAQRVDELAGDARSAFLGAQGRPVVLGPLWFKGWVSDRLDLRLADVAAELVQVLLDRARRIALRKVRLLPSGGMWLPTRVHDHDGMLYRIGNEGRDNVGLRLDQLAALLGGVDVLARVDGGWAVTARGDEYLAPTSV